MSYTDDVEADPSTQAFCCGFFTGIAAIASVSVLVYRILNTHSECDMVRKDFTYLGMTCNVTNISHAAIDETYTFCPDGRDATYGLGGGGYGEGLDDDGCGSFVEVTKLSGCEDKYTVYFTAEDDNHSAVHTSVTRQRRRDVNNMVCNDTDPLKPSYVLGYKPGGNGLVDCWKPSPTLDTSMYLEQCMYHPADKVARETCINLTSLKYECGESSCYKIVDPAENCKYWLQKLNEDLPVSIIMSGSFLFVCFVSCVCLIMIERRNGNCNCTKMKSEKRNQRKSKEPTIEMTYARDTDSGDESDMETNERVSEKKRRKENLTTNETSVEMPNGTPKNNIEDID